MRRRVRKLLEDIRLAIDAIESFSSGKTFDDLNSDLMYRSAMERQFEIIGEALRRMSSEAPETFARFPQGRQIVNFRNLIVHDYGDVDAGIVWRIRVDELPTLKTLVMKLLTGKEVGN